MRKYGISCSIILQNLAQLKTMYKDAWESITGNCDTFLFLGGQEQTTLEYVSKKLGKVTILANGYSRSRGGQGSRTESENVKGRDLMSPDEISRMDNKNCILFIRGLLPFFCKKYDYPKHKNYKYTGDKDDKFLYDYRHPERFEVKEKPKKKRNPASKRPRRTKRDVLGPKARNAGNAPSQKTTDNKRKSIQDARKPKEFTPENLASSMGIPTQGNPDATVEAIAKNLNQIGGFIGDYEFKGAENYHSEFLGKEEDLINKQTAENEQKEKSSSSTPDIAEPAENVKPEPVLSSDAGNFPFAGAQDIVSEEEMSIPNEFDSPEVDDDGEVIDKVDDKEETEEKVSGVESATTDEDDEISVYIDDMDDISVDIDDDDEDEDSDNSSDSDGTYDSEQGYVPSFEDEDVQE